MKIAFKPEVRLIGQNLALSSTRILAALLRTAPAMQGDLILVTSACDGRHKAGSLHYAGRAFDVRIYGQREGAVSIATSSDQERTAALWVGRLRADLGRDYDVILEVDHIHLEHDVK